VIPPLLLVAGSLLPSPSQETNRRWIAEVEVTGAVERLELDVGAAGRTRVELGRGAGERGLVRVALPLRLPLGRSTLTDAPAPELARHPVEGTGSVAWRGFADAQPAAPSPGLRARPVPVPDPSTPGARPHELAVALLAGVAVLAASRARRRHLGLVVGLVGAAAVAGAAALGADAEAGLRRVLEVDGSTGEAWWVRVDEARLLLAAEEARGTRVEVLPEGAELEVELTPAGEAWAAVASNARLVARRPAPRTSGWNRTAPNPLGDLGPGWLREPDGAWSNLGAWDAGARLTDVELTPLSTEPGPPGWLSAGLPPGRRVLVARLAGADPPAWVRVVGIAD